MPKKSLPLKTPRVQRRFPFFWIYFEVYWLDKKDAGSQGAAAGIEGVVEFSFSDHTDNLYRPSSTGIG
jgi:hypothetical protein